MRQGADYEEEDKTDFNEELYIDGNTVRRHKKEKASEDRQEKAKETSAHTRKGAKNQMSKGNVIFLGVMCAAVIFSCVRFLGIKTEFMKQRNLYTANTLEYNEIKAENDAYYSEITARINLDEIRKKAIEEMGMHFPQENQIIYYDPGDSSFVRQYQEVPEE